MIAIKEENKAIMMTLNTKIEELKVELVVCKVVVGKWVLGVTLIHKIDVPKLEKFKRARSTIENRGEIKIKTWEEF
ncbi:hypothetical protein Golax_004188 [Gossypium laxum]|uniref:Uncharacterized protein n=1 Tax=Gossypium laxum TaxID=34288 RepID=A0A7J9AHQ6_9ROSI|nr:hypothetical protein [Gossypium laxum]